MAHLTVGMRLEGTKGSIVKSMEYMQMHGIKFIQSKGFYGEEQNSFQNRWDFWQRNAYYDCGKVLLDCRGLFRILYISYPLLLHVMITLGNL